MARPQWRDQGRERFWRQVVRRWQRSGLSVRAFCVAESVSVPSFYAWRRDLARRAEAAATEVTPTFVPVHLRTDAAVEATSVPPIDLVLSNGRSLRVPAGFDPAMLRQLLAVAEETPAC